MKKLKPYIITKDSIDKKIRDWRRYLNIRK